MVSSDDLLRQIAEDYEKAPISEAEKAMLRYAEILTAQPWNVQEEDVEELKSLGFTDRDILDINQVVAYFNYVNRIASGLGVELES